MKRRRARSPGWIPQGSTREGEGDGVEGMGAEGRGESGGSAGQTDARVTGDSRELQSRGGKAGTRGSPDPGAWVAAVPFLLAVPSASLALYLAQRAGCPVRRGHGSVSGGRPHPAPPARDVGSAGTRRAPRRAGPGAPGVFVKRRRGMYHRAPPVPTTVQPRTKTAARRAAPQPPPRLRCRCGGCPGGRAGGLEPPRPRPVRGPRRPEGRGRPGSPQFARGGGVTPAPSLLPRVHRPPVPPNYGLAHPRALARASDPSPAASALLLLGHPRGVSPPPGQPRNSAPSPPPNAK